MSVAQGKHGQVQPKRLVILLYLIFRLGIMTFSGQRKKSIPALQPLLCLYLAFSLVRTCDMTQKCILIHSGVQRTATASYALPVCPGKQRSKTTFVLPQPSPLLTILILQSVFQQQTWPQPYGQQHYASNPASCDAHLGKFALEQCKSVYDVLCPPPRN